MVRGMEKGRERREERGEVSGQKMKSWIQEMKIGGKGSLRREKLERRVCNGRMMWIQKWMNLQRSYKASTFAKQPMYQSMHV